MSENGLVEDLEDLDEEFFHCTGFTVFRGYDIDDRLVLSVEYRFRDKDVFYTIDEFDRFDDIASSRDITSISLSIWTLHIRYIDKRIKEEVEWIDGAASAEVKQVKDRVDSLEELRRGM